MNIVILGAGGQVADALDVYLRSCGHKVKGFRFPLHLTIPGVPRRLKRSAARVCEVRLAAQNGLDDIVSSARYQIWAEEHDFKYADLVVNAFPAYLASAVARRLGPLLDGRPLLTVSDRFLSTYTIAIQIEASYRLSGPSMGIALNSPPLLAYQATPESATSLYHVKPFVVMSAFPQSRAEEAAHLVMDLLHISRGRVRVAESMLALAFDNINSIIHAVQDLENLARGLYRPVAYGSLYDKGSYLPGMIERIGAVVSDRDRVARGFDLPRPRSLIEFDQSTFAVGESYGVGGTAAYRHGHPLLSTLPRPMRHTAHGFEDIGWSLVPIESLGNFANISVPHLSLLIDEWSLVTGIDYRKVGRDIALRHIVPPNTRGELSTLKWRREIY